VKRRQYQNTALGSLLKAYINIQVRPPNRQRGPSVDI
jgi:hypothetical protein